jgi:hypothetical protein
LGGFDVYFGAEVVPIISPRRRRRNYFDGSMASSIVAPSWPTHLFNFNCVANWTLTAKLRSFRYPYR